MIAEILFAASIPRMRPSERGTNWRNEMKCLFVGNLNFETTEADLTRLFQPFGELGRIHRVTDRETSRARGLAFVEMHNGDDAEKAIVVLHGKALNGHNLRVNEAKPITDHPHSGGRDGGNRSGSGRGRSRYSDDDDRESGR